MVSPLDVRGAGFVKNLDTVDARFETAARRRFGGASGGGASRVLGGLRLLGSSTTKLDVDRILVALIAASTLSSSSSCTSIESLTPTLDPRRRFGCGALDGASASRFLLAALGLLDTGSLDGRSVGRAPVSGWRRRGGRAAIDSAELLLSSSLPLSLSWSRGGGNGTLLLVVTMANECNELSRSRSGLHCCEVSVSVSWQAVLLR